MSPTRAVIDLDAIASNFRYLRDRVQPRPVYAVVKADAYGHGAAAVARKLSGEGADRFAVAGTEEGIGLRRAAIGGEILLLSCAEPSGLALQRSYGLTPALYDLEQARGVAAAARSLPAPVPAHLELDTGMGRAGIRIEQLDALVALLRGAPWIRLAGTFANLSRADDAASPETKSQVAALVDAAAALRAAGIPTGLVHAANSAAILEHTGSWLDAVRPGLALYGIPPSESVSTGALTAAMTLETRVVATRTVPAGTALGYGGRFVAARETTVAVLPIGYHDGFRRSFSGKTAVLLRGRRAPVVGTVSMDVTLVDASATGAAAGDRAVCLGQDGALSVTAWELARAAGTIPYEILCGIGPRVGRVHTERAG